MDSISTNYISQFLKQQQRKILLIWFNGYQFQRNLLKSIEKKLHTRIVLCSSKDDYFS